jgi:hypothetical protein
MLCVFICFLLTCPCSSHEENKHISKNNKINNKKTKEEWKQIMNIKNKTDMNRLIIIRADKGKTLVILTKEEYNHKIENFIHDNHLIKINKTQHNNIKKS